MNKKQFKTVEDALIEKILDLSKIASASRELCETVHALVDLEETSKNARL